MIPVILTPKTGIAWITNGVPTLAQIEERHGLNDDFFSITRAAVPVIPTDDDTVSPEIIAMATSGMSRHGFAMQHAARDAMIHACSFAVPCQEAIEAIAASGPVLECGAGTGFWAALIQRHQGNVLATDDFSGHYDQPFGRFHPVEAADSEAAVKRYQDRNLLMVWPTLGNDWAARAAKALAPGRLLHLVSEGAGGAVGDDNLFATLEEHFTELEDCSIPQWPGIHDRLTTFRKNAG